MMTPKFSFVGIIVLMMVACTPIPTKDPDFAPVQPASLIPPVQNSGSIYQAGYDMRLFEDNKARRVGDVLSIIFNEATQANKAADLSQEKQNSMSFTAPSLYGMAVSTMTGSDLKTTVASDNKFTGTGKADQSNSLTGNISVTVIELLPNGDLKVRGEKRVTLNQGDEYVRLSGIVRPIDIDPSNTVSSDKVADATIMYTGNGSMADASKMGWLSRILNSAWIPF
ncbi:MAG: flagellar basal body L-ring protein FlgH [Methylococcales bacterium]|jgi:flagellar L-ring protein precursor FlgH|nr:MAG: flagellar basal body L-ring protein FlgH [Methylococcales bacterium]